MTGLRHAAMYLRLSISYRRALLSSLLHNMQGHFQGTVLDIGGIRGNPVGFQPEPGSLSGKWVYLNRSASAHPDILADAEQMPLSANSVDTVFCNATLEHVDNPPRVVQDISRVLRPGGVLILGVPFMYRVHSAPHDYWRFTEFQIQRMIHDAGLCAVRLQLIGRLFTVICDMIKQAMSEIRPALLRWAAWLAVMPVATALVGTETLFAKRNPHLLRSYTTGYLLVAAKPECNGQHEVPKETDGSSGGETG